jgi:O-antigen/teichoic acid export membrane protein
VKKINVRGASWDSVFLSSAKLLTMLFGILSAKILSTGLSLEEYGTYSQANLVVSIGTSAILLGLVDAASYFFNRKDIDDQLRYRIISTVFFAEFCVGIILASAIVFGQDLLAAYFSNNAVKALLPVVAVLPMLANIIYFYQIMYVAVGRAKMMSLYNLLLMVVRIIAVYLSVYVIKNLVWIYLVVLLMDLIQIAIFHMELRKKGICINPLQISFKHIGPIFAYGLPMGVYAITSSLTRDLDKLVVGGLGGTESLAIYTNCSKILPLDFFVSSFAMVLIPYIYRRVSEGRREESVALFSSFLKVGYYTVWTLGMMVLVAPESIISFLYADAYITGKEIFVLYILDAMLRFASIHLILTAAGKAKIVMLYSVLSLGMNLVLNLLFYRWWGIVGPAIATLVVALLYMFLILRDTKNTIQARWTEIVDVKDMAWFVFTLLVVWLVASPLNHAMISWGMHRYMAMILSMAVFGCSVLALHFKKIFGVLKKINSFKL